MAVLGLTSHFLLTVSVTAAYFCTDFFGHAAFAISSTVVAILVFHAFGPAALSGGRLGIFFAFHGEAGYSLETVRIRVASFRSGKVAFSVVASVNRRASAVVSAVLWGHIHLRHVFRSTEAHGLAAFGLSFHTGTVSVRHAVVHILGVHGHQLHGHALLLRVHGLIGHSQTGQQNNHEELHG